MGRQVTAATLLVPGVKYWFMNPGLVVAQKRFIYLKEKDEGE